MKIYKKIPKEDIVDIDCKMMEVAYNGLDDFMYEHVLEELYKLQLQYNELWHYMWELKKKEY